MSRDREVAAAKRAAALSVAAIPVGPGQSGRSLSNPSGQPIPHTQSTLSQPS